MSDEDTERRLRLVEDFKTEHSATSKAWWEEQRRWNININAKIRALFDTVGVLPTESEMHAIEEKIVTATQRQDTIIALLERKKGHSDVIKVLVTFVITVAAALAVWALTK